jgi:hypothetical protein
MLVLEVAVTKELGLHIAGETYHRSQARGSRELSYSAPWDVHTIADTSKRLHDPTLQICEGIGQLTWPLSLPPQILCRLHQVNGTRTTTDVLISVWRRLL